MFIEAGRGFPCAAEAGVKEFCWVTCGGTPPPSTRGDECTPSSAAFCCACCRSDDCRDPSRLGVEWEPPCPDFIMPSGVSCCPLGPLLPAPECFPTDPWSAPGLGFGVVGGLLGWRTPGRETDAALPGRDCVPPVVFSGVWGVCGVPSACLLSLLGAMLSGVLSRPPGPARSGVAAVLPPEAGTPALEAPLGTPRAFCACKEPLAEDPPCATSLPSRLLTCCCCCTRSGGATALFMFWLPPVKGAPDGRYSCSVPLLAMSAMLWYDPERFIACPAGFGIACPLLGATLAAAGAGFFCGAELTPLLCIELWTTVPPCKKPGWAPMKGRGLLIAASASLPLRCSRAPHAPRLPLAAPPPAPGLSGPDARPPCRARGPPGRPPPLFYRRRGQPTS
mmetsp:Transcript_38804/g.95490  ORF Transcript_38804/g.95490 Transcript_38804/m.95490 type:complete len:392 (+) Transcript_38804:1510-2685(+)